MCKETMSHLMTENTSQLIGVCHSFQQSHQNKHLPILCQEKQTLGEWPTTSASSVPMRSHVEATVNAENPTQCWSGLSTY